MSFRYCLILLVQEHEHFIQHHYFWNNLVYEWRQTIGGLGHASDESWIIVYACSVMLVCWQNVGNAVSTLAFHTAGQPHLSATCSSVVLFSLGTSWSLHVFPGKLPWVGLVYSGHNETQKWCSVSTIGTQYKHSSSFNREHGQSTLEE